MLTVRGVLVAKWNPKRMIFFFLPSWTSTANLCGKPSSGIGLAKSTTMPRMSVTSTGCCACFWSWRKKAPKMLFKAIFPIPSFTTCLNHRAYKYSFWGRLLPGLSLPCTEAVMSVVISMQICTKILQLSILHFSVFLGWKSKLLQKYMFLSS